MLEIGVLLTRSGRSLYQNYDKVHERFALKFKLAPSRYMSAR